MTNEVETRAERYARQLQAARSAGWSSILVDALERQAVDTLRFGAPDSQDAFAYVLAGGVKKEYDTKLFYVDVGAGNGAGTSLLAHRGWRGVIVEPDPRLKPAFDAIQRENVVRKFFVVGPRNAVDKFGNTSPEMPCRPLVDLLRESDSPRRIDVLRLDLGTRSVLETLGEHDFTSTYRLRVLVVQRTSRGDLQRPALLQLLDERGYVLVSDGITQEVDIFLPKIDPNLRLMLGHST